MNKLETKEADNKLQIFKNIEFGEVRTITDEEGNPLLCLADVCKILNLEDTNKVKSRLNHGVFTKGVWVQTGTKKDGTPALRNTEMTFITESNLYKVIFQSRKAEAEKFTEWVTSEILPQIRKHGMYATDDLLANPDLAIKVFQELKQEREKRKKLEAKQEKDKPLLNLAQSITASDDCISINTLAKVLAENGFKIGQNRLFNYLRDNKYLYRSGKDNLPMQKYVEQGLFKIVENTYTDGNGNIKVYTTTKVTGKGQQYFINKLIDKGA